MTKPTWVLETNVFSEACFDRMVSHFRDHGIPFETVRIIPFVHEVDGKTPQLSGPVVCYGSIGIQKLAAAQDWTPGVWFEERNFTSSAYRHLGKLFLNETCVIMPISQVAVYLDWAKIHDVFIKPDGDLKQFAGQRIERDDFREWYQKMLSIGYLDDNDFNVVIAPLKDIGAEYRAVVVDGKIVSASRVRPTTQAVELEDMPAGALAVLNAAIEIYQPAPVFIADVGEVFPYDLAAPEWKIIEYNNFNSAGFYECDVGAVIDAVNAFVTKGSDA